jgi:hypothetical protein
MNLPRVVTLMTALYFPPRTNVVQIIRYKDPKKMSGWIKTLKKELKTIIGIGTLNKKDLENPNNVVVSTPEANKIKLDQDRNVDKLKVRFFVR